MTKCRMFHDVSIGKLFVQFLAVLFCVRLGYRTNPCRAATLLARRNSYYENSKLGGRGSFLVIPTRERAPHEHFDMIVDQLSNDH